MSEYQTPSLPLQLDCSKSICGGSIVMSLFTWMTGRDLEDTGKHKKTRKTKTFNKLLIICFHPLDKYTVIKMFSEVFNQNLSSPEENH